MGEKLILLIINGFVILILSKYKRGRRHESTSSIIWNSGGEKEI